MGSTPKAKPGSTSALKWITVVLLVLVFVFGSVADGSIAMALSIAALVCSIVLIVKRSVIFGIIMTLFSLAAGGAVLTAQVFVDEIKTQVKRCDAERVQQIPQ